MQAYIAAVINESCEVSALRGVDDGLQVNSEQIRASDSDRFVLEFSPVSDTGSDHLSDVLNDHLVSGDRFHCKQAPVVNGGFGELQLLVSELQLVKLKKIRFGAASVRRQQSSLVESSFSRCVLQFNLISGTVKF